MSVMWESKKGGELHSREDGNWLMVDLSQTEDWKREVFINAYGSGSEEGDKVKNGLGNCKGMEIFRCK